MSRLMSRSFGNSGGRTPPSQKLGGGGGDEGEKVFFDDGQVRVTESLVTIGHPWNKAFAVSRIPKNKTLTSTLVDSQRLKM